MSEGYILDRIQHPRDLRALSDLERLQLANEIRERIVHTVSRNGGHLASNLGVVELTIALLMAFDLEQDQIVWDVGHQAYTFKLLTGRAERFDTLRTDKGISGFPKREESLYDAYNTGHSSTSISASLGILRAKHLLGQAGQVVAVIGDGALTGGQAFEALNDAGQYSERLIVVLNDNQMSIQRNHGSLARHLREIRLSHTYLRMKSRVEIILNRIPLLGRPTARLIEFAKSMMRRIARPFPVIFEDMGFKYFGPIDGHDMPSLASHLESIREIDGPVLLHVCTQKGKGYTFAEESPEDYHGVAPFEIQKGINGATEASVDVRSHRSFSDAFGIFLADAGDVNPRIVAVTAAMCSGTGLSAFAKRHPQRFFDVCIAEQHAVTMACGMATRGIIPVVAIYSTFLQRAFDQILHDAALQRLHIVFAVDRAGVVGEDGETHQGVYDLAYLLPIPGLEIFAPRDYTELNQMLLYAVEHAQGPVVIRYPRGPERKSIAGRYQSPFSVKKAHVLRAGKDVTLAACGGAMIDHALAAADLLAREGVGCEVLDIRAIKPLDWQTILASCDKTERLVTMEDGVAIGGVGAAMASYVAQFRPGIPVAIVAAGDHPIEQGSIAQIHRREKMDAQAIVTACRQLLATPPKTPSRNA